jgi:predicted dithiol-disulfide oxidoreductase (DUF899 family)
MNLPPVVSAEKWKRSNDEQIEREKAQMRRRDELGAARRRLPMVPMTGDYEFEGPDGKLSLLDLFDGRSQLIAYSFYFPPGEQPCAGCSMFTDNLGHPDGLNHLRDRDATFTLISLASQDEIAEFSERMGWRYPWVTDVNRRYSEEVGTTEYFKLNVLLRQGDEVFRTYWTGSRGVEALAGGAMTDLLPYGRQEEWEDSPEGWPEQPAYTSGALHDSYGDEPTVPSHTKGITPAPPVVSEEDWESAVAERHAEEKAETRERDALAAERRRRSRELIDEEYEFEWPGGKASLLDLFEGRGQLLIYHFMLEPGSEDPCPGCSMFTDQVGRLSHLNQRDTTMAWVSLAPIDEIERVRERMGWDIPWYSSAGSDFNADFGRTTPRGEMFGLSAFIREGDDIYRTYFTSNRGVDGVGTVWTLLDLTALGRQEEWEDSPEDYPQTPAYQWWKLHDEYDDANQKEEAL